MGETLNGLLLNAWGWSVIGMIATLAGLILIVLGRARDVATHGHDAPCVRMIGAEQAAQRVLHPSCDVALVRAPHQRIHTAALAGPRPIVQSCYPGQQERLELRMAPRTKRSREDVRRTTLHGHDVAYRQAGSGPVVVLVHGITSSSATWKRVMPQLAERFTVIAPDLAGHGESAKPRGDYSLGAHASGLRDLLLALGHERATFVGHSLGGGIAMQFSYQFPERCERLVLVDSGGLGRDVNWLLRAATLPGSELVLPLLAATRLLDAGARAGGLLSRLGLGLGTDLQEIARGHSTLSDGATRAAFVHTLRAVVEPGGQRVDASNRLYLAEQLPFLLIWGERDSIIPVSHGHATHELMPNSRLEVFPRSGHFPQLDEPERFLDVLIEFIDSTEPAAREMTV